MATNSFGAHDDLVVGAQTYEIFRLERIEGSARPLQLEGSVGEPAAQ